MAGQPHPLDSASLPSVLTFSWVNPLILRAWRQKGLKEDDVWDPAQDEDCRRSCTALEEALAAQNGTCVFRSNPPHLH